MKARKEANNKLRGVLNESVYSIKVLTIIQKVLKLVWQFGAAELPYHAQTGKQTCNANQWASCNTTLAQKQARFQKRQQ